MTDISLNLNQLHAEIQQLRPGKPPIKLIAVSKLFPVANICTAVSAGQTAFGENYAQELLKKSQELQSLNLEWHFIGNIQSNKTRLLAKYAAWVHTLTEIHHANRLNAQRPTNLPPLQVLIEVNISHEESKHGLTTFKEILVLAMHIARLPHLKLRGLMGMASATHEPTILRTQFQRLGEYLAGLRHYGLAVDQLSMGMSDDYQLAIECGATILRIGSKIFGARTYEY